MERLRPYTHFLPLRAFLGCAVMALAVQQIAGGSLADAVKLLGGILPVGMENEGMLRALLGRSLVTFGIIVLSMVIGVSTGLAVTVYSFKLGGWAARVTGWLGRALAGLPPMSLGLAAIWLMLERANLPVETLFPYEPPIGSDSVSWKAGRMVWSWMVPALVLAVPVMSLTLWSLTNRLGALWPGGDASILKARGLSPGHVLYAHLLPQLRPTLVGLFRWSFVMLLPYALAVEEILRVNGWGRFMATALRTQNGNAAAAALYIAGGMLALWWLLTNWLETRGQRDAQEKQPEQERSGNFTVAALGVLLAAGMLAWAYTSEGKAVVMWQPAFAVTLRELGFAAVVALLCWLIVASSGYVLARVRGWRVPMRYGVTATLSAAPVLLTAMALSPVFSTSWQHVLLLAVLTAIPETAYFRDRVREICRGQAAEASRMLGSTPVLFWHTHGLRLLAPVVGNGVLRTVATVLLWNSLLGYFGLGLMGTEGWGRQIYLNADGVLNSVLPVLLPGVWLALWCLSFRLMGRAFRA